RGWSSGCRRPRSSPPLPYTTLFRSAGARGGPHRVDVTLIVHAEQRRLVERRGLRDLAGRQQARGAQQVVGQLVAQWLERVLAGEDRKSTRLNSSHVRSSHAVLCLKN